MKNKTNLILGIVLLLSILVTVFYFQKDSISFPKEEQKYAYIPSALVDAPSTIASDLLLQKGIKPVPFVTGRETVQALMGGAAFSAALAEWPFLLASNSRNDLRVVAMITTANSMGILANKKSGINSVADLKDKRIGFPQGTSAQFLFESFLNSNNILDKVKTVNLSPPQLQPALLRDDIQAMVVWQPFLERARLERPDDFFYIQDSQDAFKVIYLVVSTKENIKKYPDKIQNLLESLIEAEDDFTNKPNEILKKLSVTTGLDESTLTTLLPLFKFEVVINDEIIETWAELASWAHSSGLASDDILNRDWKSFIHTESLEKIDSNRVQF